VDARPAYKDAAQSRIEPRQKFRRYGRTQGGGSSKNGEARARDNVVGGVAERARDGGEECGGGWPWTSETAQDVNQGIRAGEQPAGGGLQYQALGKVGALRNRDFRLESLAVERREAEMAARAVAL
jgi:hypothetical protein